MDYFRTVAGTACANAVKCGKAVLREGSPRTLAGWRGDGGGRWVPAGGHLSDHRGPGERCLAVGVSFGRQGRAVDRYLGGLGPDQICNLTR